MEDKRIELVSNEFFALQKVYQILATIPNDGSQQDNTNLQFSHQISPESLLRVVILHNPEITLSDCEIFLETF